MLLLNTAIKSPFPLFSFACHLFMPYSKVRIFVHQVVVISNFPALWGFVLCGKHVEKVVPRKIGFETDHVFGELVVVVTQKDLRVVLILHEKLHRRFN